MRIGQICSRRIVTVDGASTPLQAAGLMRDHHVAHWSSPPKAPKVLV